ncbi:MAG: ATP-binding cassette domain-containing protein [Pirellulaceae bacterium]
MQAFADTIESPQLQPATEAGVVLRAEGLRKSFGGQVVIDGVDAELRRGEVVLLEGENGSGKTTLINILTGNLHPDSGTITLSANANQVQFRFPQRWISRFNPINRFAADTVARHGFGRTWQDVRLFDSMTLRDNIAVAVPNQAGENPLFALMGFRNETSERHIAEDTLKQLGLEGREQSSGEMISLGQSKRVAIARAVAAGAKVLLLDEPLAGLDRKGVDDVLAMLAELVEKHQVTLVIVEHALNQGHLKNLITSHWHLENGKLTVVPSANVKISGVLEQPHWFQMLADAADEVITEALPRGAKLTRIRIDDRYEDLPILEIKDLVVKRGNRTVVGLDNDGNECGFDLTINRGEIGVLLAPNGWGKSTLIDTFCCLLAAEKGTIEHHANEVSILRSSSELFPSLAVKDAAALFRGELPQTSLSERRISSLSGGERQSLCLQMLMPRSLWILDEPFLQLDETFPASEFLCTNCANGCLILCPQFTTD